MQRKLRDTWCARLDANEDIQGRNYLRQETKDRDAFCCLGVLADIVDPNGWVDPADIEGAHGDISTYAYEWHGDSQVLPDDFSFGLKESSIHKSENDISYEHHLTEMNDKGSTFPEISAWIKENVPVEDDSEDDA